MRRVAGLGVLVALLLVALIAAPSPASPADEGRSLSLVQEARAGAGRPAYRAMADLQGVARRHAAEMASSNRLRHNPELTQEVQGWRAVGENVGRGTSVEHVHQLLMGSATHRANILSTTYTEVGIGVAWRGDVVYVAQVFRQPSAARPAPAPPAPTTSTTSTPPPPARRAAPPSTERRPAPPTTTTTVAPVVVQLPQQEAVALAVRPAPVVTVVGPAEPRPPSWAAALATALVGAVLAAHVALARRSPSSFRPSRGRPERR